MKHLIAIFLLASVAQAETSVARNCDKAAWAKYTIKTPNGQLTQEQFFGGKCDSWIDGDLTSEDTVTERGGADCVEQICKPTPDSINRFCVFRLGKLLMASSSQEKMHQLALDCPEKVTKEMLLNGYLFLDLK